MSKKNTAIIGIVLLLLVAASIYFIHIERGSDVSDANHMPVSQETPRGENEDENQVPSVKTPETPETKPAVTNSVSYSLTGRIISISGSIAQIQIHNTLPPGATNPLSVVMAQCQLKTGRIYALGVNYDKTEDVYSCYYSTEVQDGF